MEEQIYKQEVDPAYVNEYVTQVYLHLFLGLLVTGVVSYFLYSSGLTLKLMSLGSWVFLGLGVLGLILVFAQSFAVRNVGLSALLFYLFSILEGVSLSPIFFAYTKSDISKAFFATAFLFLALYFLAKSNVIDIRKYYKILFVMLIIGVIASIINLFISNNIFDLILTWFLLIVFSGLLIYDLQTLEELAVTRNPFIGALSIYITLINLFLLILRLFSNEEE
jgi:FtsH-binding integral membrane protein